MKLSEAIERGGYNALSMTEAPDGTVTVTIRNRQTGAVATGRLRIRRNPHGREVGRDWVEDPETDAAGWTRAPKGKGR